jgi:hypothetical protein
MNKNKPIFSGSFIKDYNEKYNYSEEEKKYIIKRKN